MGESATLNEDDPYAGARAVQLDNTSIQRVVDLKAGHPYKLTAWAKIQSEQGEDWGGFRLEILDYNWNSLAHSGWKVISTFGEEWRKIAVTFLAPDSQVRIQVGYFGGPARQMSVLVDDLRVFEKVDNIPPALEAELKTMAIDRLPAELAFQALVDDPDGAVQRVVWDFGDGGQSLQAEGSHTVKRLPLPGWLSTSTRPPWASQRCLTIARPNPTPSACDRPTW